MDIATYLSTTRMTDEQFSALVDVSRPTVSRYRKGIIKPSAEAAIRIATATRGQVTFAEMRPDLVDVVEKGRQASKTRRRAA